MPPAPSDSEVALQAAVHGNLGLLKKMANKVDLRVVKDTNGENALHFAAVKGRLEICKFLVQESGLDVNSRSTEGETPMLLAAAKGNVPVLRYLMVRGGDLAVVDGKGTTPLHHAAERGHCEALRLLLSKGVPVDPLDHRGTPLHLAAAKDQDGSMKLLLKHGADPNRVIHHVFSPLVMACCAPSLKCMKLLVEAGANVNFKSPSGPTALMMAVDDGLTHIVKFLVDVGADPNIRDHHGKIPIMYAAGSGRCELVEILLSRTKPIPNFPDWSVDGIINTMKYLPSNAQDVSSVEEHIGDAKSKGQEAFAKGEYLSALYLYGLAMEEDPCDAALFANRSLCWLRLKNGKLALVDAQQCKVMCPRWSKAWFLEGAALSFLENYKGAAAAYVEALKLDPESDEIKRALREAIEAMRIVARSQEQKSCKD